MRGRNIRDSALVSPVGELEVLQGQLVVLGLDIVGENIAVSHCFVAGESGVSGTSSIRDLGDKTMRGGVSKL